jgi:Retinal pigment epithelial membrane protein
MFDGVVKLALEDNDKKDIRKGDVVGKFVLPQNWHCVSEPTIVRKTNGVDGNYVLLIATQVTDHVPSSTSTVEIVDSDFSMKSKVVVLDGDNLDKVVFALDLPYKIPYGLHSMFLDWDNMK